MLKNSVLVYRIRALVGFLNAYYEKSISQKIFSKLGQGLSLVLGGSFLARLGKKSMDGAYVNRVLSGLYRGLDRGGQRLTNWKESARGPSLLGAYASQFQDPLEGLCGLGWTLFFWSLVLGIFRPEAFAGPGPFGSWPGLDPDLDSIGQGICPGPGASLDQGLDL